MNHQIETPIDATPVADDVSVDGSVDDVSDGALKCASAQGGIRPFVAGCAIATSLIRVAALAAVKKRKPKNRYTPVDLDWHDAVEVPLEDGTTKLIPFSDLVWGPRRDKDDITRRDTFIWKRSAIPNPFRTVQAEILRDSGLYLVDESNTSKSTRTVVRLYAQAPSKPSLWHRLDRVPGVTKRVPAPRDGGQAIFPPLPPPDARAAPPLPVQRAPPSAGFGGPMAVPPGCVPVLCPDGVVRLVLMAPMQPVAYPPAACPPAYPPAACPPAHPPARGYLPQFANFH